ECASRLREAIDPERLESWRRSRSVMGRVSGRTVRLRKRLRYRNSFQTVLTGTLEQRGQGCIFRAKAGMHPFVSVVLMTFLLSVGIASIGIAPAGAALLPTMMLLFGVTLVVIGRYSSRGEDQFLIEFVAKVLAAPNPRAF